MSKKVAFLVLLFGLPSVGCQKAETPPASPSPSPGPSGSGALVVLPASVCEVIGVQTEKAAPREFRAALKAMGKVCAPQLQTAIVSHVMPGRIAGVHAAVGDWVKKGQRLVTLECPEVGDAKCEFYKAVANFELSKLSLLREQSLASDGIGAKKDYLAAETENKVAQVSLDAAEKKLHVLGFTEEQVEEMARNHQISPTICLCSPIDGKVVESKAVVGAMVDQSKEILTIIDPKVLWVDAEIYEKDLAKVKLGQGVEITLPAYPDFKFEGKISYMGDVVREDTRSVTVRTEVGNEENLLKPGMFANVSILFNGSQKLLAVPVGAILEEGDKQVLFVRKDAAFEKREVETGVADKGYRHVVKGVDEGEEVVVQGNHQLNSTLKEDVLDAAHAH